jgi:hypothetical protein
MDEDEPTRSKIGPLPPEAFDGEAAFREDADLDVNDPEWKEKDAALVERLKKTEE